MTSPFAPAPSEPDSGSGIAAMTGGDTTPTVIPPASPFAAVADSVPASPADAPRKTVLPPKRMAPAAGPSGTSLGTPFEKATAPVYVNAPPASTPPPEMTPPPVATEVPPPVEPAVSAFATSDPVPVPSPFAPVTPSPFGSPGGGATDHGGPASAEPGMPQSDEDKVDALLRQFKERYGRD